MSWNLGDEANPKSMKGCTDFGVLGLHGRKVGKLLRKIMRKPHYNQRTGRQKGNKQAPHRAVGAPASFAHGGVAEIYIHPCSVVWWLI